MLIVGERLHPEVIGLIGWSGGDTFVACSEEECATLSAGKELAVVAQTTCPEEIFEKIVKFVSKGREKTVEIFKTICYTTKERQEEAEQLAKNSDAMLVIGGANSSNTNRLKEICSRYCANVFRLTDASEFRSDLLKNFKNVGIVSGASTPDTQTQEVLFKMENNTEVNATNVMDEVVAKMEDGQAKLKKGQLVTAIISSATDEGVAVLLPFFKKETLLEKEELECEEYSKEE